MYRLAWKNICGYEGCGNFDYDDKERAERVAKHKTKISAGFFNFWIESEEDIFEKNINDEKKEYQTLRGNHMQYYDLNLSFRQPVSIFEVYNVATGFVKQFNKDKMSEVAVHLNAGLSNSMTEQRAPANLFFSYTEGSTEGQFNFEIGTQDAMKFVEWFNVQKTYT